MARRQRDRYRCREVIISPDEMSLSNVKDLEEAAELLWIDTVSMSCKPLQSAPKKGAPLRIQAWEIFEVFFGDSQFRGK